MVETTDGMTDTRIYTRKKRKYMVKSSYSEMKRWVVN